jgi:LmbE family N-acetylglucosaminyl deacetylase
VKTGFSLLRFGCPIAACACLLSFFQGDVRAAGVPAAAGILQDLHRFDQLGSVLYVAAHPDDENTQLITYLARGRLYRTAYLSLTRGDGGQNLLGPEFGDELGVIRTQELLSARRLDGGQQFFSRARDFGYSKDFRQTLDKWDHQEVLSDIVRCIRTFRPDVVITRFSTVPSTTHGHHTASAVLALEAFKTCGDPKAFPEQLPALMTWQPKRIFLNGLVGFRRSDQLVPGATSGPSNAVRIDISGSDPLLGISFGEIAARSRAMHKTQGFGNYGGRGGGGPQYEAFQLLDGEPASKDILDGVDTTWNRFPGGGEIEALADQIVKAFQPEDPAASVPALLDLRSKLKNLPADPVIDDKRRELDRILQACLGISVQTTVADTEVVPGEPLKMRQTALISSSLAVRWSVRYPALKAEMEKPVDLSAGKSFSRDDVQTLPAETPLSQPYWLREPSTPGMFRVDDPALIGRPENPPAFPVENVFEVGGQELIIPDQPVQILAKGTRRLDVIAPVSLSFVQGVGLFAPGGARPAIVEVVAHRADAAGTLSLVTPAGWTVTPATQPFHLTAVGDKAQFTFTVTAPPQPVVAQITADAQIGGSHFDSQRIEISYDHIPVQLLQPTATMKAVCLDLEIRGHNVGYLAGAGDSVAESLAEMGYNVTQLTGADLTADNLKKLDTVVVGIRAFNVRTDLASHLPALFAYVRDGGNLIVQYNTPSRSATPQLGPFDIKLSGDLPHNRVTNENAPVTLLVPDHPAFNTPNKIVPADFDGWVQERGLNFPSEWDKTHYTALLSCSDPGEAPLTSGLLVAHYGQGYFVYTGISWFRQLPAGVPGAFRLFANLVSLGK